MDNRLHHPSSHTDNCDYHFDQYPWECTCAAGRNIKRVGRCQCVNVDIQTYTNQVAIKAPGRIARRRWLENPDLLPLLSIDRCIAEEIENLLQAGVTTTGCCCGHNTHEPYIGVITEHVGWMRHLGYQHASPDGEGNQVNFLPKSVCVVFSEVPA